MKELHRFTLQAYLLPKDLAIKGANSTHGRTHIVS
uniref:Uncharacterized protein n=1 Tax=Lotus japonicus TaxID=34305 RepID=I3S6W6_LOTJA|nr:unknown [Lotus japonicus]